MVMNNKYDSSLTKPHCDPRAGVGVLFRDLLERGQTKSI
jgi:hypothetical protein